MIEYHDNTRRFIIFSAVIIAAVIRKLAAGKKDHGKNRGMALAAVISPEPKKILLKACKN